MTKKGIYNTHSALGTVSLLFVVILYYFDFKFSLRIGVDNTQFYLNISTTVLLILSYATLKIFKYDDTSFNKMMLMMDSVTSSFFIILFIFIYSQAILFAEFAELFKTKIVVTLFLIAIVSFFYGIYYGYVRWNAAISEILFDIDSGKIKFYFAFSALIGNSNQSMHSSKWLYGVVAVISPVIAKIYGHSILLFLATSIMTPMLPIHIASIMVRRYLLQKYITPKRLILI